MTADLRHQVLLTPGSYYTPWQGSEKITTRARDGESGIGHFRLAFSTTTVCSCHCSIHLASLRITLTFSGSIEGRNARRNQKDGNCSP